jgi:hypothetical protein
MTAPHAQQIINGYLAQLERELSSVAAPEQSDLVAQIEGHIADARATLLDETDSDILNILDRLGSPEAVAQSVPQGVDQVKATGAAGPTAMPGDRLVIAGAFLAWAGGLASAIAALLLFAESDFGSDSVVSLFAGGLGVVAGIYAFTRTRLALVAVFVAALAAGTILLHAYSLPPGVEPIAMGAFVLLLGAAAFSGLSTVVPHSHGAIHLWNRTRKSAIESDSSRS